MFYLTSRTALLVRRKIVRPFRGVPRPYYFRHAQTHLRFVQSKSTIRKLGCAYQVRPSTETLKYLGQDTWGLRYIWQKPFGHAQTYLLFM